MIWFIYILIFFSAFPVQVCHLVFIRVSDYRVFSSAGHVQSPVPYHERLLSLTVYSFMKLYGNDYIMPGIQIGQG